VRPVLVLGLGLAACAGGERRFPVREPLWRDGDLDPVSVACRPDPRKPGGRLCRPGEYESSFAWDGFDNLVTRPLAELFAVKVVGPAVNVNSLDEVPDSSWFTNRIGRRPMTAEEVMHGPCDPRPIPIDGPDGSVLIDQGKMNGANPGFRVRLPDGRRYMLKGDIAGDPERATGATTIATRLYHAAGWWAACDSVVYVRPSLFTLKPGLTVTDNTGVTRAFDRAALAQLLANASRRGDLVRMSASEWLPGRTLGPFTYDGVRKDDPNDVVRHEDRRDLRGARLIAAWLNHFDSREQNSMSVWLAADPNEPDGSPGHVRHYYLDLGDCFGSRWALDGISRRLGHSHYLDFGHVLADFLTLGLIVRPWDRTRIDPAGAMFGYFGAEPFEPEKWKPGYPNPAFERMTEADGAWAARILARFTDEHIAAAVAAGDFTERRHSAYLARVLASRRDDIARRYLSRLSPVTDVTVEGDELCALDLARRSGLWPEERFRYAAETGAAPLAVRAEAGGRLCLRLPPEDGYRVVTIANGQAPGRLRAHVAAGKLVGLER
jgi:hypothetical protein